MKIPRMFVVLLLVFCGGAQAAAVGDKLNPISRVVELLNGLVKKIESDGKMEEDLFETYVCWYKTVVKSKTASNAAAKDRIESLEAYIDDIESGRIEFTSERSDLEEAVKKLTSEIEQATELRDKEHEDYLAAKDEMEKAVAALEEAVQVLDDATAEHKGSLLAMRRQMGQLEEGSHAQATLALQNAMQLGKRYLSKGDAEFLDRVLSGDVPEVDWKKLNRKASFKMKYKARSGKIQKIMSDMLQTFKDNLADATSKEEETKASFDKLMESKKAELEGSQKALTELVGESGARGMAKEDAQQEVDDLKAQVEADEGFIKDTEEGHKLKMEEWKERKKLRTLEIASINQAIAILHGDDARDTFKSSFESQGYLLLQRSSVSALRQRASAVVRQAGKVAQDSRLSVLAMRVLLQEGGHFDKVLEAVDKMVATLRAEEAEDLKNKEDCEEKRLDKTKEARTLSLAIDDSTEEIDRQRSKIVELKAQVVEKEEEIVKLEADLKEATQLREDEKSAYDKSSADDHAATELIKKAMDTLKGFYEDNGLVLVQRAPPVVEAGKAPPPPPPTFSAPYGGAKGESTGIQAILGMILEDVEKDIKTADDAEEKAQAEFDKMKADTEAALAAAKKSIEDYKGQIADAETAIQDAISEKTKSKETLDAVMEEIKVLEPGCDFIAVNVGVRTKNRQLEIDGLLKAKAILQGAVFGEAPDPDREMKPGDAL